MEQDRIGAYLSDLRAALRLPSEDSNRILAETEDHLCLSAERERANGATPDAAERNATLRFGAPDVVAKRFHQEAMKPYRKSVSAILLFLAVYMVLTPQLFFEPYYSWDDTPWRMGLWNAFALVALLFSGLLVGFLMRHRGAFCGMLLALLSTTWLAEPQRFQISFIRYLRKHGGTLFWGGPSYAGWGLYAWVPQHPQPLLVVSLWSITVFILGSVAAVLMGRFCGMAGGRLRQVWDERRTTAASA